MIGSDPVGQGSSPCRIAKGVTMCVLRKSTPRDEVRKKMFPNERDDFECEYELENDNEPLPSREYHGALKYVNKPPQELKRLLQTEKDPEELKLLAFALRAWETTLSPSKRMTGGEPIRSMPRKVNKINNLRELVDKDGPVSHIRVLGKLC